jgi:hypothetical protein
LQAILQLGFAGLGFRWVSRLAKERFGRSLIYRSIEKREAAFGRPFLCRQSFMLIPVRLAIAGEGLGHPR